MFVRTENGQLAEFPYDLLRLRLDNPTVSFPGEPDDETLAEFGVYRVELVEPPEVLPTQRLIDIAPALVDGLWYQQFGIEELPEEEAAEILGQIEARQRDLIVAERVRRLGGGFDHDFGDSRGVHRIGTTDHDMKGWDEVSSAAGAAVALGQGSTIFQIVTDTGPVAITALEWQSVLLTGAAVRQAIWAASFALQAMNPIPDDPEDDAFWP